MLAANVTEYLQAKGPQTTAIIARRFRQKSSKMARFLSKSSLYILYKVGRTTYWGLSYGYGPTASVSLGTKGRLYSTIMADPPWLYDDRGIRGAARHHYKDMSVEKIAALPVLQRVLPDSHCYLWVTVPKFLDGVHHEVLDGWGFKAKTVIVWLKAKGDPTGKLVWAKGEHWLKVQIGNGHWFRGVMEFCIFATRGRPKIPPAIRKPNAFFHPRTSKHSQKPEAFRNWVADVSPGPRLELFAESSAKGWDRFGKKRKP